MTTSLDQLLTYQSLNLHRFEIRGAKPGVNNARSTGPVYTEGPYYPEYNIVGGMADCTSDSSTISYLTVNPPYALLTAESFRPRDTVYLGAGVYQVTGVTPTSLILDATTGLDGRFPLAISLISRDYLVEPDIIRNTTTGTATFTFTDEYVTGVGTSWLTDLKASDFIKHDGFQNYYVIDQVLSNTSLKLTAMYVGDTTTGAYTTKRTDIGRIRTQYTKNDFAFDNQSSKWKYDATTGSDFTTSRAFAPLVDGIQLRYTDSIGTAKPDLMDFATVLYKTFARKTQNDIFQFPVPVIPEPEESFDLCINNKKWDRYPAGNRQYVLSYSPNPIYESPLPPEQRQVCSIMFLKSVAGSQTGLSDGYVQVLDGEGNNITGLMPGSSIFALDGTDQTSGQDYVLEPNAGLFAVVDHNLDEPVVKYVAKNFSGYIDYGLTCHLNGVRQQLSFPPNPADDLLFQVASGRMKPRLQDTPGPDDRYEFHYQVDGEVVTENPVLTPGQTAVYTALWPVKRYTLFISKNGVYLDEDIDFRVSYQTGAITLTDPVVAGEAYEIVYTPLSKQTNILTYDSTGWGCTVQDARLTVMDSTNYKFQVINPAIGDSSNPISILRVYNETRQKDYNLAGMYVSDRVIQLAKDASNLAVGLNGADIVTADYSLRRKVLEYAPVSVNYWVIPEGATSLWFEGVNIPHLFPVDAIIRLAHPDNGTQYYFLVDGSSYTGTDTKVDLRTAVPEELTNPAIFVTDDPITFLTVPLKADAVMTGANIIKFPGRNIRNLFRPQTILKMGDEMYGVLNASYEDGATVVTLFASTVNAYTEDSVLSAIQYSDCPVYAEGTTEIMPFEPVVTIPAQPGLTICQKGTQTLSILPDSTALFIDSSSFDYADYPTLADMSSAIGGSFSTLAVGSYIPQWPSRKLIKRDSTAYVYTDSSTVLNVGPELRYDGTDSTRYAVTEAGTLVLTDPLQVYDRYNLDYMGRAFLPDSTASYTANYFVILPKKSNVKCSFQYRNLDQFYIESLSQQDFLESVMKPRMTDEAYQLNGNSGQGGEVPGDDAASGNGEGGTADDAYRLRDLEIECRVTKNIYDFFQNRLSAFGNEMVSAEGVKLFNNNGVFNENEQVNAVKVASRIFPNTDYTSFPPEYTNPTTGRFYDSGAFFTKGSSMVYSDGESYWTYQLKAGDFVSRTDRAEMYQIASVWDATLRLSSTFQGVTTSNPDGDLYVASAAFPEYDDDGNVGAKIVGSKSGLRKDRQRFKLRAGNIFDCSIDGTYSSYTFTVPGPDPFLALMFAPRFLSGDDVARLLSNSIVGLDVSYEQVIDPNKPHGFRMALVARTVPPYNVLSLGGGAAVRKLGFVPGTTSIGNLDRTDLLPETVLLRQEGPYLYQESLDLAVIDSSGTPDKFGRWNALPQASNDYTSVGYELPIVALEIARLEAEIAATSHIIQEPSLPSYGDTTTAYNNAVAMYNATVPAYIYDSSVYPSWEGKGSAWKWVMDWTDGTQIIRGKDSSGIGVDQTSGIGITPILGDSSFILYVSPGYDIRYADTTAPDGTHYRPRVFYENSGLEAYGYWDPWETPVSDGTQSVNNELTFHLYDYPLFTMGLDATTPVPTLSTALTYARFEWNESEGPRNIQYNYGSYPKLSALIAGIKASDGFEANSYGYDTDYDYTNLQTLTGYVLPGAPGYLVKTGSFSPALHLINNRSYRVDATAFYAGGSTYLFASYPTIGSLASALGVKAPYQITYLPYPSKPSNTLNAVSGILNSTPPGTSIYSDTTEVLQLVMLDPTYDCDTTAFSMVHHKTSGNVQTQFLYASYPTLGDLITAMDAVEGIMAFKRFDISYSYGHLTTTSGTITSSGEYIPFSASNGAPLFRVFYNMQNQRYAIDQTSLNLTWERDTSTVTRTLTYTGYPTVGDMKARINQIMGLYADGPSSYDSETSAVFKFISGVFPPDATVSRALSDCTVGYVTISDRIIDNRRAFVADRSSLLVPRITYLDQTREQQIRNHVRDEQILRSSDGGYGDLWVWANNRFNRRQGCNARLSAMQVQLAANQSALSVNRTMV